MKKRLLVLLLAFVFIVQLFTTVSFAAESGSTVYLAFSSDVHNQSGDVSSTRLKNWINAVSEKLGVTFDNMGFCGDMGPQALNAVTTDFWPNAKKAMDEVKNNENVLGNGFFVCGNHEYSPGNYSHNVNDVTRRYSDPGDYIETPSYILYSFGARQYDEIFHDDDIAAMSSFLDSHSDFKGPIFILSHFPLHRYTRTALWGSGSSSQRETSAIHDGNASVGSAKVISALNKAVEKNGQTIVFLWGHNHSDTNQYYDAVYTDSINNTPIRFVYASAGCMADSECGKSENVKGKGLVAAISENSLTMSYYEADGTLVGTPKVISLAPQRSSDSCCLSSLFDLSNLFHWDNLFGENSLFDFGSFFD